MNFKMPLKRPNSIKSRGKMARVGLNGVLGIHLAPKAVCLFYALRQHPPKKDKNMNQFLAPITPPT